MLNEKDLYGFLQTLIGLPQARICKHWVAAQLLSLMEQKGSVIDPKLAEAVVCAYDKRSLTLIEQKIKEV